MDEHQDSRLYFSHKIDDGTNALLSEFFDRFKDRKTFTVHSSKMTKFHGEFSKRWEFRVPLHPKNTAQLIHPFYGYLASFKHEEFTYDRLYSHY